MEPVHTINVRINWVDYARGICIVFVVLLYSTGTAESVLHTRGWIHVLGDFAQAFRMPDFFLISGLFVSRAVKRPWHLYLDTKLVHFFYFYSLWITIDFIVMHWRTLFSTQWSDYMIQYFSLYLQPHGQLWFIYILPIFFLTVRVVNVLPIFLVGAVAVALKLIDLDTGWKMVDRFGMYFVFFYAGHVFARNIFTMVESMREHLNLKVAYLLVWSLTNSFFLWLDLTQIPIVSLILGLTGALALILVASMLSSIHFMSWIEYLGKNSIVIYVGFGVPMIFLRKVLLSSGIITDIDVASLLLTVLAITGALALLWLTRNTWADFLFRRPAWISFSPNESLSGRSKELLDTHKPEHKA